MKIFVIIIPQGSLRSFRLERQERSDMMKEIFHLQRFDLASSGNVKVLPELNWIN
jgi:hypothetical protein